LTQERILKALDQPLPEDADEAITPGPATQGTRRGSPGSRDGEHLDRRGTAPVTKNQGGR
jgi:hypothetical protein